MFLVFWKEVSPLDKFFCITVFSNFFRCCIRPKQMLKCKRNSKIEWTWFKVSNKYGTTQRWKIFFVFLANLDRFFNSELVCWYLILSTFLPIEIRTYGLYRNQPEVVVHSFSLEQFWQFSKKLKENTCNTWGFLE